MDRKTLSPNLTRTSILETNEKKARSFFLENLPNVGKRAIG